MCCTIAPIRLDVCKQHEIIHLLSSNNEFSRLLHRSCSLSFTTTIYNMLQTYADRLRSSRRRHIIIVAELTPKKPKCKYYIASPVIKTNNVQTYRKQRAVRVKHYYNNGRIKIFIL